MKSAQTRNNLHRQALPALRTTGILPVRFERKHMGNMPARDVIRSSLTSSPGSGNRPRAAFTLIELIVSLAITAILAATLFASLRTALNAKAAMDLKLEPSRTGELAMEFLRTDFQNALQPTAAPGTTPIKLVGTFEGTQQTDNRGATADDVIFYTTSYAPHHVDGNGDVKELEVTVVSDPKSNDHLLVRKVLPNLLAQVQPDPDQEVICRGVAGFSVRYFDGSQWLTNWDSTQEDNTIPAAVEITLQLSRPAGRDLPDQTHTFVRVFPLSCSTAALDSNVNSGLSLQ